MSVLAYAVAEQRILVTCDGDFGDLIFGKGAIAPPAVIYIRFEPQDVANIVPRLVRTLDFDELRGHMTVIGNIRNRRAPFPMSSNDNG
jgi:predicted nuclease of predicted toxin-antitoxin system